MNPRELVREVLGVVLLGLGVFLLASLLSFDVGDLPARVAPARPDPVNLGGRVGVALAAQLLLWVGNLGGLAACLIVLLFAGSCLRRVAAASPEGAAPVAPRAGVEPLRRVMGGLIVVLTASVLERILAGTPWGGLLVRHGCAAGGYWGMFLESELSRLLGGAGSSIALGVVLSVGLVLCTDRTLAELLGRSVDGARVAAAKAADGVIAAEAALASVAPEAQEALVEAGPLEAVDPTDPEPASAPAASPAPAAAAEPEAAEEEQEQDEDEDQGPAASTPRSGGSGRAPRDEEPSPALPPVTLLAPRERRQAAPPPRDERGKRIEETLAQFKVQAQVVSVEHGPSVALFALELGKGVKVQRVASLLDNLALALRVPGIRLQAPIPGTGWVGLEVPNEECEVVRLRELVEHPGWKKKDPALPIFLGKDSTGRPLIADLAKMPHLLIAGATGSGKSVCINSIILSLLMTRTPRECQLILIDPKQVEMAQFQKVPHLLAPVVTDMRQAGAVLEWIVQKMEQRYTWLAEAGVRHIREYNELGKDELCSRLQLTPEQLEKKRVPWKLPYVVLVVDELNDLMMIAQKEVEASITRLAQKSRAVGIHVVLATQRPSVDVITGVIKSNLPARIAFRVAAKVDSRTILDAAGADKLLGQGDMLFLPPGRNQPIRALGALVTDEEVQSVVKALTRAAKPDYCRELVDFAKQAGERARTGSGKLARDPRADAAQDPAYLDAVRLVLTEGKGSVSLIQRKLEVGYGRAARFLDQMAEEGLVGPAKGAKPREVKLTLDAWESQRREAA